MVWYKVLAESGKIFAPLDANIPNFLNGVPREAFGSEFNVIPWLYVLFKPFTAYVINEIIMRIVAFWGMYMLLRNHVLREDENKMLTSGVALAFSFLPFLPTSGLSFAGQPLVLNTFLNIRIRKDTKKDWIVLCLVPFYSSLVLTFSFFLAAMTLWWFMDWIRSKRFDGRFLLAIVFMGVIYLIVEYRLVYGLLFDTGIQYHRQEFYRGVQNIWGSISLAMEDFFKAHTHDRSLHGYFIFFAIGLALWKSKFNGSKSKWLARLLALNVVLSLWYGFWHWQGLRLLKDQVELLNTFNFSRFHLLSLISWYIAFALALAVLARHKLRYLVVLILILQIGYITYEGNPEVRHHHSLSYREFYSEQLFQSIQDYIGRDPKEYRVISLGMYPSIPQYNGFYTLDGYITLYPLKHKHEFREVIAAELKKNKELRHYYDRWGSRCYVYSDELNRKHRLNFTKDKDKEIDSLELNTDKLKQLGGEYILSAVKINNSDENNLKLLKIFEDKESPWKIYLYKVT